jgi:hypothetical protein
MLTKSGAAPERLRLGAKLFAMATSAGIRDRTASFERPRKFHPRRFARSGRISGRGLAEARDADAARQASLNGSLHEVGREERECEIFLGGGNLTNSSPGRNRSGCSLGTPEYGLNTT